MNLIKKKNIIPEYVSYVFRKNKKFLVRFAQSMRIKGENNDLNGSRGSFFFFEMESGVKYKIAINLSLTFSFFTYYLY